MNTVMTFLTAYGPSITAILGVVASILYSVLKTKKAVDDLKSCDDISKLRAEVKQGDGFEGVEGTFDVIVSNPPIRAGKAVIYGMFDDARGFLRPGGAMYIVIRKQQGAPSAITYLKTLFGAVDTVEKKSGFWIIRCREPINTTEDE